MTVIKFYKDKVRFFGCSFATLCSLWLIMSLIFFSEAAFPQDSPVKQVNYLQQGIANLKEENYEEAVEDFKKVREENPDSSIAAYLLGLAYKKVQDYKEAKIHLKDALILKPEVKEAVPELSDVLYQLGEMKEALKEIEFAEGLGMESARTSFLKGQVLSKLGKNMEAIISFKKSKDLDERLITSADYQIAMVNLQEGSLEDARDILKEIVIKDPNADIAQAANQYIEIITKRLREERPFRFTAGIQYQYDTNAILKPSDETAAGGITGEEDNVGIINLRGEYVPKLKSPYNLKTQYSLYQNTHSRLKYIDVQSHSLSVVPGYNFSKGSINLLTSYNYTFVDNSKYLQTITLSPALTYFLTRTQFGQVTVKYQDKRYLKSPVNSDEDRDGNEKGLGLSYFYLLSEGKGFINGRYELNREDTEGMNWKWTGNKAGLSLFYPLSVPLFFKEAGLPLLRSIATGSGELNLNIGGEAYFQNFDEVHTTYKKKRDDKTYTFNTMLIYKLYEDVDIQLQYIYMRADSTISVYGYNKNMMTVGVEGRF